MNNDNINFNNNDIEIIYVENVDDNANNANVHPIEEEHAELRLTAYIRYTFATYNYYDYLVRNEMYDTNFQKFMFKLYMKIHRRQYENSILSFNNIN